MGEVEAELHRPGLVEPVFGAQPGDQPGVAAAHLDHQRVDGVARRQPQQQEGQADDDQQHRHRLDQAPDEERFHRAAPGSAGAAA